MVHVMVHVAPFVPFTLGMDGSSLTCMVLNEWVFDSLDVLSDFTKQVVASLRDTGVRKWTNWLREDLGSRPYAWLGPDFVPLSPFLVVLRIRLLKLLVILVERHLIDAEFRARPGCLFSVGLVILLSLLTSSWVLSVIFCLRNHSLTFPRIKGAGLCKGLLMA